MKTRQTFLLSRYEDLDKQKMNFVLC